MDSSSSSSSPSSSASSSLCVLGGPSCAPASSPTHRQTKRACLTSCSDQTRPPNLVGDQGGPFVEETTNRVCPGVSARAHEASSMSAASSVTSNTPNAASDESNGHVLESAIIQSRYTEAEMAAEPLLGVANWLNCPPSALKLLGALSSPAPKYHTHKAEKAPGNLPGLNQALSGPEVSQKLREDVVQGGRAKPSDPTLFVWDLDETLIIFQTLSNGRFAELFKGSKDPREASELGRRWESLILDVCDDYFFYKQVEDYNEPSLMSLQDFDDGADLSQYAFDGDNLTVPVDAANKRKLAYRHRCIAELYTEGLEKLLSHDQLTEWRNLYEATDNFTDGWLTAGRELLEECQRENQRKRAHSRGPTLSPVLSHAGSLRSTDCDPILKAETFVSNYNILVTSGTLVPSLVKCLLFRLDKYFHHFNIYSSREVGKLQCFHWIKERVEGLPLRFCVIGDGVDECEAAHVLSWPFVKINTGPYALHRLPTVSMDILHHYMRIIYDPPDPPKSVI